MQDKLQELTNKIYREGLSKGQEEAAQLVDTAKKEAAQIIADAKIDAEQLLAEAKKLAAEAKTNAEGDIQMAARQMMAKMKQSVENLIISKVIAAPSTAAMNDTEFLKAIIKTAIERFDPKVSGIQLSVLLPSDKQQALQGFVTEQAQLQLSAGVDFQFHGNIKAGFKIGPKNGGYHISLTDKDFENLFAAALRPHIRTLLFGQ
jgi:V/A-type H+-transporting ATPase subunit E